MKVVKCILKPSRIAGFKEEFIYLEPKMIKPNNNNNNINNNYDNLYKDKERLLIIVILK